MTAVALADPPALQAVDAGFGVYVHVPFCAARCSYCDFVTYTGMEELRGPYARALVAEAELAVAELAVGELANGATILPTVTSVFVGGGTPTLLPPAALGRLLRRLRELLPFAPDPEITVEANPETVTTALAEGLAEAGVGRVSIGAQSFDPIVLAAIGRTHDERRVAEAVRHLRAAGLTELSLDLIYGCPEEDERSWEATLDAALDLAPPHLSAYALTIEPATRFGRLVAAGRMIAPADDALADRYERTCERLAAAGYAHYEVSNWALGAVAGDRIPLHASRHNLTYWHRGRYLGLGAGAHEFAGNQRRWNGPAVPGYLAAVAAGERPRAGSETLSRPEAEFERLALGLRVTTGLSAAEAPALGVDPSGPAAVEMRAARLLRPGRGLALTERGMFLHGEVLGRL